MRLARKDAVVYLEYVTTDGVRGTTYAGYDAADPIEVAPVDEVQGTEYPTNEAPAEVPVEVPVAAPSDVSQTSDACMGDVVLRD